MGMHNGLIGQANGGASCKDTVVVNPLGFKIQPSEKTLGDYIARKQRDEAFDSVANECKWTFDEWAVLQGYGYWYAKNKMQWSAGNRLCEDDVKKIWRAAQENKPLYVHKITFAEWWKTFAHDYDVRVMSAAEAAEAAWKAAQENK